MAAAGASLHRRFKIFIWLLLLVSGGAGFLAAANRGHLFRCPLLAGAAAEVLTSQPRADENAAAPRCLRDGESARTAAGAGAKGAGIPHGSQS
jgi:hypothetical protein